jgi:ATP adenylyltransferase
VLAVSGERFGVNALGFAGFLLIKSATELEAVVTEGPAKILEDVGWESMHEMQVADGPELDGDTGIP